MKTTSGTNGTGTTASGKTKARKTAPKNAGTPKPVTGKLGVTEQGNWMQKMGSSGWAAIKMGEMGELLFGARAAGLGLTMAKPFGSAEAFDVVVWNREAWLRVQVKVVACEFRKNAYNVPCGRQKCQSPYAGRQKRPYTKEEVDFVVVYLLRHDVWYVIPVEAIGKRVNLYLSERPLTRERNPWWQYRERWDLLLGAGKGLGLDLQASAETKEREWKWKWKWVMTPGRSESAE